MIYLLIATYLLVLLNFYIKLKLGEIYFPEMGELDFLQYLVIVFWPVYFIWETYHNIKEINEYERY